MSSPGIRLSVSPGHINRLETEGPNQFCMETAKIFTKVICLVGWLYLLYLSKQFPPLCTTPGNVLDVHYDQEIHLKPCIVLIKTNLIHNTELLQVTQLTVRHKIKVQKQRKAVWHLTINITTTNCWRETLQPGQRTLKGALDQEILHTAS